MTQILFPCCGAERAPSAHCEAKLWEHIITALVVAIIGAVVASIAAYALSNHSILWTAVAGGGTVALLGTVTYIVLRCCFGRIESTLPKVNSEIENPKPQEPITVKQPIQPTALPEESIPVEQPIQPAAPPHEAIATDQPTQPATPPQEPVLPQEPIQPSPQKVVGINVTLEETHGVYLSDVRYKMQHAIPVDRTTLPDLISHVDQHFVENMINDGVVYYDPTNELPVPLPRLFQEMVTHPDCGDKRDVLLDLLANELMSVSEEYLCRYLYSLDRVTLLALACRMAEGHPNAEWLQDYAYEVDGLQFVAKQEALSKELKPDQYLGVALADGSCLFHTMAQLLSHHFEMVITEKALRMQCMGYLNLENPSKVPVKDIEHLQWSVRDIDEGKATCNVPSRGESDIHAQIIANLYGVTFALNESHKFEGEFIGGWSKIRPRSTSLTLEVLGYKELPKKDGELSIAAMCDHFYPIWINC